MQRNRRVTRQPEERDGWNLPQRPAFFPRMSSAVPRRGERRGRDAELRGSERR